MEKAPDAMFMPIIRLDHKDSLEKLEEYEAHLKPFAYEIIPMKENSEQMDRVKTIAREGRHLWINSLWDSLNLGHSDDKAVNDPEGNWGWILEKGATIIQTDRPAYLIKYLESKGCRWK